MFAAASTAGVVVPAPIAQRLGEWAALAQII